MQPLADRLRPTHLTQIAGQDHLVGPKGVFLRFLESGNIPSFILWGPPGVGKTTLANIIAHELKRPFYTLSAVHSGVKEVRETIQKAEQQKFFQRPQPILFIDEIHRFSKSQQDSLLGAVEKGTITLIGATTENPSFEVISALLSRCQVYLLNPLDEEACLKVLHRALQEDEVLKQLSLEPRETESLIILAGGDGRKLLNIIEMISQAPPSDKLITNAYVEELVQQNLLRYDKGADQHYDMASALIKSIRGSDPNAAVYWLARMLAGGEDVKFIARRLIISAAEDVGLANPNALLLAQAAFQAVHVIGMPEARIILSEAVIYLASSPKSNSAYMAIQKAWQETEQSGNEPIPLHLRNAPTSLMKTLGYGKNYQYAHDYEKNFVQQDYMPERLTGRQFYFTAKNAQEDKIRQFLKERWKDKYDY